MPGVDAALKCYAAAGKAKGLAICRAFAAGCGGEVVESAPPSLLDGPAFFYGWNADTIHLLRQAQAEGREFFYADNAYGFGYGAEIRVTRGALMHDGRPGPATLRGYDKLKRYGAAFRPWQKTGRHIVIACQTDEFYRARLGTTRHAWVAEIIAGMDQLKAGREIRTVEKPGQPTDSKAAGPLMAALRGAWALVTYSSMAGVQAICDGVPVFSDAAAFSWMGLPLSKLHSIESPSYPDDRERWLATLLANQWTMAEIADGTCWRDLQRADGR